MCCASLGLQSVGKPIQREKTDECEMNRLALESR